jgi:GntR family transcriptional regulator
VPASIETSYFPRWLVTELPRLAEPHDIDEGTTLWVSENGHPMVWHDDVVLARGLNRDEVMFFGASTALGALVRTRVSFGSDGRVLRLMDSVYRSDMYQLRFGIPGDGNQEGPAA